MIGPNHKNVKQSALLSNAVAMDRYTQLLIPNGLDHLGLSDLMQDTISFADRDENDPKTIEEVFNILSEGLNTWIEEVIAGETPSNEAMNAVPECCG